MKLLDLFSCAGGAAEGYRRAGFIPYCVDIDPQPNNPFPFHQGDAIDVMRRLLAGEAIDFTHPSGTVEWLLLTDFVVAVGSPPCQEYSVTRHSHSVVHPALVEPTRELLIATGLPYVIENVPGAPLLDPLLLCGSMFGLRAPDVDGTVLALRRHRLFESNVWLMGAGGCIHDGTPVGGSYGGGRNRRPADRDKSRCGGYTPDVRVRGALLGIDWMNQHELAQAIPPAYTEFLGEQLIASLAVAA